MSGRSKIALNESGGVPVSLVATRYRASFDNHSEEAYEARFHFRIHRADETLQSVRFKDRPRRPRIVRQRTRSVRRFTSGEDRLGLRPQRAFLRRPGSRKGPGLSLFEVVLKGHGGAPSGVAVPPGRRPGLESRAFLPVVAPARSAPRAPLGKRDQAEDRSHLTLNQSAP